MTNIDKDRLHRGRRDFLKVAASFGGGAFLTVAAPKRVGDPDLSLGEDKPKVEKRFIPQGRVKIYPIYEIHEKHADVVKEFLEIEPRPSIYFTELTLQPEYLDWTNAQLLSLEAKSTVDNKSFGRAIPDHELNFFSNYNIGVAIEGLVFNKKYADFSHIAMSSEKYGSVGGAVGTSIWNGAKLLTSKDISPKEILLNVATILSAAWAAPTIAGDIAGSLEFLPENSIAGDIKEALININKNALSHHPEDLEIFLRNLIGTRKLQVISNYLENDTTDPNPGFVYRYGFSHKGIEDLLTAGEDVTIAGFNRYPAMLLKDIVDANGGIDAFCTTKIMTVKRSFLDLSNKSDLASKEGVKLVDNKLRLYLQDRFNQQLLNR